MSMLHHLKIGKRFVLSIFWKAARSTEISIRDCHKAFLDVLQESEVQVKLLCRIYLEFGSTPPQTRGVNHKTVAYQIKKDSMEKNYEIFTMCTDPLLPN